jgi:hypothetical protein
MSKAIEIYRGIKDIYPDQINHRYDGEGVFGRGTYYALDERTAEEYALGAYGMESYEGFAFVFTYSIKPKNALLLTPDIAEGLTQHSQLIELNEDAAEDFGMNQTFPRDRLGSFAHESGYDAIILESDTQDGIDGGDQMLIPPQSPLKPKPVSFTLFLSEDEYGYELAEKIAEELGGDVSEDNIGGVPSVINIDLPKLKKVSTLLKNKTTPLEHRVINALYRVLSRIG